MEESTINQPVAQSEKSASTTQNPNKNQKGNLIIVLGVVVLLLVVGGVAYFLSSQRNKSQDANENNVTQVNNRNSSSPIDSEQNPVITVEKFIYINDGDVYIYDLNTKQGKRLTSHGYNSWAIISPDNAKIAFLSIPDAVVKSGKVQKFTGSGLFDQLTSYGEYQDVRNVWIINVDGSNPVQLTKDMKQRRSIAWSADSSKISFEEDGQIIEYDLNNKKLTPLGEGTNPIYSPNGSGRAFVFDNEKTLQVFNNKEGQAFTHQQSVNDLSWSNKDNIFFTSVSKTNGPTFQWKFSVWVYPMDGKPRQITQEQDRIHSPSTSPNEGYLAASQGSGYADAGNIDLSFMLLKMNNDLLIAKQLKLEDFKGPSYFEKEKQFMFPVGTANWLNDMELLIQLDELLDPQPNPRGLYKLNVETLTAERLLEL